MKPRKIPKEPVSWLCKPGTHMDSPTVTQQQKNSTGSVMLMIEKATVHYCIWPMRKHSDKWHQEPTMDSQGLSHMG